MGTTAVTVHRRHYSRLTVTLMCFTRQRACSSIAGMSRLFAMLFALSLMLVGCGGSGDAGTGGGDTGSDAEVAGTITIADFAYGEPLTVPPGALIKVINEDSARHDVDAKDGTSFNTDLLGQGEELTFNAPDEEGTYDFTCSAHPQMSGELIVGS